MISCRGLDEPPERLARPLPGRASFQTSSSDHPADPLARATLEAWLASIPGLEALALSPLTRVRLEDCRRICEELRAVLSGTESGEGRASERTLHFASVEGHIQALSSMFACPGGTFIELLATAPWNILGHADPPDPRTVRGAGTALVMEAMAWSSRRGCGGRVALQAENPRTLPYYEKLGFFVMQPSHRPLLFVPRGEKGWSSSIQRVALGMPGREEERSPWLLLDPMVQARQQAA